MPWIFHDEMEITDGVILSSDSKQVIAGMTPLNAISAIGAAHRQYLSALSQRSNLD